MKNKGFTLLETLVAVAVLSLALSGVLTLASMGIRSASSASKQITAFFLANESIEYVRNKRDSNLLAGSDWLNGLSACQSAEGCYADVLNNVMTQCGPTCPKIKFDSSQNLYNYSVGEESIFTRQILIAPVSSYEIKLTAIMSWPQGELSRSFTLEERLFNLAF